MNQSDPSLTFGYALRTVLAFLCVGFPWKCFALWDPYLIEGYLDVTCGTRFDKLKTIIDDCSPSSTPPLLRNTYDLDHLYINELGIEQEVRLCCNWVFQCSIKTGLVHCGCYHQDSTSLLDINTSITGRVYKGITHDTSLGFGYLCPFSGIYKIGPLIGWSYHYQRVKMNHLRHNHVNEQVLNGLTYKNHWQGFWFGIEGRADICSLMVIASYHYTPGCWNAVWVTSGINSITPGPGSDRRESSRAHGHEAYFEIAYIFTDCYLMGFKVGCGVNFEYWKARTGHAKHLTDYQGVSTPPDEKAEVKEALWKSWDFIVNIGWEF